MKKKPFLYAASVVMILIGLLRGIGGIMLAFEGNKIDAGLPIVASQSTVRLVAVGLIIVSFLLIFSAIFLIRRTTKNSWLLCWTALILFLAGGAMNGYLLFGHPIDKGQMINISAAIICSLFLYLGKTSLKDNSVNGDKI